MTHKFDADMEKVLHEALDAEVYSGNRGLSIDPDETDLLDLTAFCLDALLEKYELKPRGSHTTVNVVVGPLSGNEAAHRLAEELRRSEVGLR